jgi:hypothetical protein
MHLGSCCSVFLDPIAVQELASLGPTVAQQWVPKMGPTVSQKILCSPTMVIKQPLTVHV